MNYFNEIIKSLNAAQNKEYTPRFSIKKENAGWRIFDKETDIAYFRNDAFDIWKFSPFEEDVKLNKKPYNELMDLHTVHSTYINLGMQIWPKHWKEQLNNKLKENPLTWNWKETQGATLKVNILFNAINDEKAVWTLTIDYDQKRASYRFLFDIHISKHSPDMMECFNLMTTGALATNSDKRRWTHTIWENSAGNLRRFVHSTAFLSCTDFLQSTWRTKNISQCKAWLSYAANKVFNPCILIDKSSVPIHIATCQNLFDEHICWSNAGTENLENDGLFHFKMSLEIVNVKYNTIKAILDLAKDPILPTRNTHDLIALPFYMNKDNLFEKEIDIYKPQECPTFAINQNKEENIKWVKNEAYEGTYSIGLTGKENEYTYCLPNIGAVCSVEPHKNYRLTAWVKTENIKGYASIELFSYEYTTSNIIHISQSIKLQENNDWTCLEVELDSKKQAYIMPRFTVYGIGNAWFDKVKLELIDI